MEASINPGAVHRPFIADTLQQWLIEHGVQPVFIAKASPQQNCYIERFNGSMRRELLNGELFDSVWKPAW